MANWISLPIMTGAQIHASSWRVGAPIFKTPWNGNRQQVSNFNSPIFLPRIFVITLVIPRKPCWSLPEKEQLSPRIDRGTNYFRDSKVCVVALSKTTAPVVTSIPRKSFGRWELTLGRAIISYFVRGIVNDGRAEFCENSRWKESANKLLPLILNTLPTRWIDRKTSLYNASTLQAGQGPQFSHSRNLIWFLSSSWEGQKLGPGERCPMIIEGLAHKTYDAFYWWQFLVTHLT